MLVKFKVSKGRCHEFYAIEHDGTVVEACVHPVTGKTVRMTRVPPQPGAVRPRNQSSSPSSSDDTWLQALAGIRPLGDCCHSQLP